METLSFRSQVQSQVRFSVMACTYLTTPQAPRPHKIMIIIIIVITPYLHVISPTEGHGSLSKQREGVRPYHTTEAKSGSVRCKESLTDRFWCQATHKASFWWSDQYNSNLQVMGTNTNNGLQSIRCLNGLRHRGHYYVSGLQELMAVLAHSSSYYHMSYMLILCTL